jgi:uncharacterized protein (TIGR02266 family)
MWERRSEERVKLRIWVEERVGETVYYQRTANLSRSGLFLEGTIPHEPGTKVRLSFSLPDADDLIDLEGEVVGAGKEQTGMGIRILDIRDEDAERLEKFIKEMTGE